MTILERAFKVALKALTLTDRGGLSLKSALERARLSLSEDSRQVLGLAHRLAFETLKRKETLDFILSRVSHETYPDRVSWILRMLTYEFKLNPSASLGWKNTLEALRRMLNLDDYLSCVRLLVRLRSLPMSILLPEPGSSKHLAVSTSNPEWFTSYAVKLLGLKNGLSLLRSLLNQPPTYFRVNTLKTREEDALNSLKGEGFEFKRVKGLRFIYRLLASKKPIVLSKTHRSGYIYVQDLSSCLAVEASGVKPGYTVVDVCAAPGAKTSHLAQLMDNRGLIVSVELSKARARLWARETSKMGVLNANMILADASRQPPIAVEADLVLVDPPCSGTGVFHRDPSLKWRIGFKDVRRFSKLQLSMLLAYANLVKPGGCLMYSTCSITLEENEMVVERFLNLNPDFQVKPVEIPIGEPGLRGFEGCRRLYPHLHGCNGFFMAKLVRHL